MPHRQSPPHVPQSVRTGLEPAAIRQAFHDNLFYLLARFPAVATRNDYYLALAYTIRDRLLDRWLRTAQTYYERESRTVCYLSAEFLLGPHLGNNLLNLGIREVVEDALRDTGLELDSLLAQEEEPGLGNGGLGRLAACFLDSLATLEIPTLGYGIRYEFGIFDQEIRDGWQVEKTDTWLRLGNPWEIRRPELAATVAFGGHTEPWRDEKGRFRVRWNPEWTVRGVPYDTPILGYRVDTANLLRLWRAEAFHAFDFRAFNEGDYYGAVESKIASENLTKVLYPNDEPAQGRELRLRQQYFLVSCALQDMARIFRQREDSLEGFDRKYATQLNDTHPALAIPELMRILVDEELLEWEQAWEITRSTFSYTNHTLLPEALEKWPVPLFQRLLPRHLEILFEINHRFLAGVRERFPDDESRVARMSLIEEGEPRQIRMAHLACVGSHTTNGVSKLHTELLTRRVLADFESLWPERFRSITNGVTPRRFLALCNPGLRELLVASIGEGWIRDLDELEGLEPLAEDASFREAWRRVKRANKIELARIALDRTGISVDPDSFFDVHVKRIHEYKRQHLNLLHVISLYLRLLREPDAEIVPRTFVFAGKAAPGYFLARLMIRLVHSVAEVVHSDPVAAKRLRVVFLPDFNVQNAEPIYPAAELSEQISTAGFEASGTGNMKLGLNGALTIGTLDGANVEMREAVGDEHFFLFGHTAEELEQIGRNGYDPGARVAADPRLAEAIDLLRRGHFSHGDKELFRPLIDSLLTRDPYFVLADFPSYADRQQEAGRRWREHDSWTRSSILNVARLGRFSSDRAIREYCETIWKVEPVPIDPGP